MIKIILLLFLIVPLSGQGIEKNDFSFKELFAQLFSRHIIQDPHQYDSITTDPFFKLKDSIYFNKRPFPEIYQEIINQKSSFEIYKKREEILSNDLTIKNLPNTPLVKPNIKNFRKSPLNTFYNQLNEWFKKKDQMPGNYFSTEIGQVVLEQLKDFVFIILPGYGNNFISDVILPDIVKDINLYYGRPQFRPYTKKSISAEFKDYKEYYKNLDEGIEKKFDIIQPLGLEIGLPIGRHSENSKKLYEWIKGLPSDFSNKKIVFVGYSKGTTTALEILKDYEDIRKRTRSIISMAGPFQGSSNVQNMMRRIFKSQEPEEIENMFKDFKKIPSNLKIKETFNKVFSSFQDSFPLITETIQNIPNTDKDIVSYFNDNLNYFLTFDVKEAARGIYEEGQTHMLNWNFEHFKPEIFPKDFTLISLSFLSNYKDVFTKGPISNEGDILPQELLPLPTSNGSFDLEAFSPDTLFEMTVALDLPEKTPGGLMDSQVSWADSKPIFLDPNPISNSFTEKELLTFSKKDFLNKRNSTKNIPYTELINRPRREFFKEEFSKINYVDLGEVRGSHWSTMFRQVIRVPNTGHNFGHTHTFPHGSMFKAILESFVIQQLIKEEENNNEK